MKLRFWKKRKLSRDEYGRFTGSGLETDGTPGEMKGFEKSLNAMTKTLNTVSAFENALTSHTLQKLEAQRQYQDLQADMLDGIEDAIDGEEDIMKIAIKALIPHLLGGVVNKSLPQEQVGWPPVHAALPAPVQPDPEPPLDTFNRALKQINMIPDKMITEDRVKEFAQAQGLDYKALQGAVTKLSRVIVK